MIHFNVNVLLAFSIHMENTSMSCKSKYALLTGTNASKRVSLQNWYYIHTH